jgi:uncharacterized repeat protein (TIGR01451 family)
MTRLIALVLTVALMAIGVAGSAMAQDGTTIAKALSQSEAQLGDWIQVTLTVDAVQAPVTVTDTLPDQLSYIPGTFQVDGVDATPDVEGNTISCELDSVGLHTIEFYVQMTTAEAEATMVTNQAEVGNATDVLATDSQDITLLPYEGFTKEVVASTHDPWDEVPVGEDVQWTLLITVENIAGDQIGNMTNIVVKDNFGGDLELEAFDPTVGIVETKLSGCTEKVHLFWSEIGYLDADGASAALTLAVSTDVNPGTNKNKDGKGRKNGHQEYTSEGEHDLNSGATLKFIDADTGLKLSAHTPSIVVYAYEPAS